MKKLFNLKRLLKKRNNGGFTLVEVVISCALLGILVVGVVAFASPIFGMIASGQKNARATMLAETLDSYIAGCLKNARCVDVIQNTSIERLSTTGIDGTAAVNDDPNSVLKFMKATGNAAEFEVRCLGICWVENKGLGGKKKQMLVNCRVDNNFSSGYNNLLVLQSNSGTPIQDKVFDDSLYDGLFPVINVETFKSMDEAGAETATNAHGYKITANIYTNPTSYNVISEAARDKASLGFRGVTFAQCMNMKTPANDIVTLNSTQNTIDANRATRQYTDNGTNYYYPDTYIYYVVPK